MPRAHLMQSLILLSSRMQSLYRVLSSKPSLQAHRMATWLGSC